MYERVVTAFYLEKNAAEARAFAESAAIAKLDYLNRIYQARLKPHPWRCPGGFGLAQKHG
jgi:hypothetical protein